MAGLGEALTSVGGAFMQHGLNIHKDEMLNKLEQEKEKRTEERTKRQEERASQAFSETRPFQTANGLWMEQDYNKAGQPMANRPARPVTPDRAQLLTNQQQTDKLTLENAILGNKKSQFEIDNMAEDKTLDREYKRSQIEENRNTGLAAVMRADAATTASQSTGSFEDAVDDLVKDSADIQRQYTTAKGEEEPLMTPTEYRMVVKDAVKAAAQRGKDPREFLTEALRRYVSDKRSPAGKRALSE